MRLALITDQPRPGAKITTEYVDSCIHSVATQLKKVVEHHTIPAVPDHQPRGAVPGIAMIRQEMPGLRTRIAAYEPDAIMTLGPLAFSALTGDVTKIREEHARMRMMEFGGREIPVVPAHIPYNVVKQGGGALDQHRDFMFCIEKVLSRSQPFPPMDVDLHVVEDVEHLRASLALLEGATALGVDVETGGFSSFNDPLYAIGIGAMYDAESGICVVVPETLLTDPEVKAVLREEIYGSERTIVGHNFKFDMQFMADVIEWPTDTTRISDSMLLAALLDERPFSARVTGIGLKQLVSERYDHNYGFDFTDYESGPKTPEKIMEMHKYLGEDCVYTTRLWLDLVQEAEAEDGIMRAHDDLLRPVSVALAQAEWMGAPIDTEYVSDVIRQLDTEIDKEERALVRGINDLAPTMTIDNIHSPAQIKEVIYSEWGWVSPDHSTSTDREHLESLVDAHKDQPERGDWVTRLLMLRRQVKTRTTYIQSLQDHTDEDERIRASFLLHGAATGRLSSQKPNLQNIPAVGRNEASVDHPMRRAFAPGEGRLWVEVDYSQLELRVAAALSGDPAFGDVFRDGRDIHMEVAMSIFSKPEDQISKAERFLAKAVSFGIIYGRSARALAAGAEMDYAERELGMTRWDEPTAQAFINKFLRKYPRLTEWMGEMHSKVVRDNYIDTPFGRRRRFPLIPENRSITARILRQAVNSPVQSVASDICLEAMAEITNTLRLQDIDADVLFPVHDSICLEVAEHDVHRLEVLCRGIMERDYLGVPMKVDFEAGPNWADMSEV